MLAVSHFDSKEYRADITHEFAEESKMIIRTLLRRQGLWTYAASCSNKAVRLTYNISEAYGGAGLAPSVGRSRGNTYHSIETVIAGCVETGPIYVAFQLSSIVAGGAPAPFRQLQGSPASVSSLSNGPLGH